MSTRKDILTFIDSYCAEKGFPPTYREIGDATGLESVSAVHFQVHRLVWLELLTMIPGRVRTMQVTPLGRQVLDAGVTG